MSNFYAKIMYPNQEAISNQHEFIGLGKNILAKTGQINFVLHTWNVLQNVTHTPRLKQVHLHS